MGKFNKLFIVALLIVTLTGCGNEDKNKDDKKSNDSEVVEKTSNNSESKEENKEEKKEDKKLSEMDLESIMEKLYADIPEDDRPMYLENIEVNDDNIESFIGTKKVKYEKIIASESMTGSTAHSVVLIKVKKGEDINKIKKEIKDKVNPRKWVCVGIEKDEVIIKSKDNIILLVIVDDKDNRGKISNSFDKLK